MTTHTGLAAILVAAGYGTLEDPIKPKVVESLQGTPLVVRCLRVLQACRIDTCVVVVNPLHGQMVRNVVRQARENGDLEFEPMYEVQPNRYGAADAVLRAIPKLEPLGITDALVMYADMPMWSRETIDQLRATHMESSAAVSMITINRQSSFTGLNRYGRVVHNEQGRIVRVVEVTDERITRDERRIPVVNPSLWIWKTDTVLRLAPQIKPFKRQDGHPDELHMPPLIEILHRHKEPINELRLPATSGFEALGVNTRADLLTLCELVE